MGEIVGILVITTFFFGGGFLLFAELKSVDESNPLILLLYKIFGIGVICVTGGFIMLLLRGIFRILLVI